MTRETAALHGRDRESSSRHSVMVAAPLKSDLTAVKGGLRYMYASYTVYTVHTCICMYVHVYYILVICVDCMH